MEEKLLKQILQEILDLKEITNKKFEEIDSRFEKIESRLDEIDGKIEGLKAYVDYRFDKFQEYVDNRFDDSKKYIDNRFDKLTQEIVKEHKDMMEIAYKKDNREVGKLKNKVQEGAKEFVKAVSY